MTYAISGISDWLKRPAVSVCVLTLLFAWPGRLAAQAAGSTGASAGTAKGRGDAEAQKQGQHRRTPQEIEEAVRKRHGNFKKSPKIKNTRYKDDPEIAAQLAALEELRAGRSRSGNKSKGSSGDPASAGGPTPSGQNPTGASPSQGGGKTSGGGSAGTPSQPGTPTGGTPGTPGAGTPPSATPGRPSGGIATMATARAPAAAAPLASPPSSGSGSPSSPASRALAVQPHVANVLGCSTKMVMIQSINGIPTGVANPKIVFTQDPQYNDYKISGCNFGQSQGQAHLTGPFRAGQVAAQIEFWTDTEIELKVDPKLTGEPDQNNVSLVIVPAGGTQAQLQNCKFYAMRQELTLTRVPQSAVRLASIVDDAGAAVTNVKYLSPYNGGTNLSQKVEGTFAAGVDRFNETRFNPQGTDVWDLSGLAPGFVPTQFSLGHWDTFCADPGMNLNQEETVYTDGRWGAQWDPANPKQIVVSLAEWHCHSAGGDTSNSSYALEIQVSGPTGVNPWP